MSAHHDHEIMAAGRCGPFRRALEKFTQFNDPHHHHHAEGNGSARWRFKLAGGLMVTYALVLFLFARGGLATAMRALALENLFDGGNLLVALLLHRDPFDLHSHSKACNNTRLFGLVISVSTVIFISFGLSAVWQGDSESGFVVALIGAGLAVNVISLMLLWSVPGTVGRSMAQHYSVDVLLAASLFIRLISVLPVSLTRVLAVAGLGWLLFDVAKESMSLILGLHRPAFHWRSRPHHHVR